jgi:hypothetical protein
MTEELEKLREALAMCFWPAKPYTTRPHINQMIDAIVCDGDQGDAALLGYRSRDGEVEQLKCTMSDVVDALQKQIADLERWKEEALQAFLQIDTQRFGELLDLRLGQNVYKAIVPAIEQLNAIHTLGVVYVPPDNWNCAKQGGLPEINDYEEIDLVTYES